RPDADDGAHHRRERDRKGIGGPRHPPPQQRGPAHLPSRQLCRHPGQPSREPTVRPRPRRLHRRAVNSQEGLFRRAKGGTIFLDEIGELPLGLQSKLLRTIEAKEVLPVGSAEPVTVDVRVIAASNRDLNRMVDEGKFRKDLLYRLNVFNIHLPPLRERREDIPGLVEHLVRRHNREMKRAYRGVDDATLKLLLWRPWEGNVRELDHVIEHAMIVGNGEWITVADLPRAP